MSRRWENKEDGRLCLVIDSEDGTQPQRVYGKDKDEVLEKVARTAEHAARWIAPQKPSQARVAAAIPTGQTSVARKPMTADEQMQRTADLQNPAKAPLAVRALMNEATDGAMDEFEEFRQDKRRRISAERLASTAGAWANRHPEFHRTELNKKLLCDGAVLRVGIENVTEDVLQEVYLQLFESGYLQSESSPAGQPDETPANSPARSSATSYRRTALRANVPATSNKPRYTRAEVDALPADKMLEKYRTDPEFRRAVDTYASPARSA